MYTHFNNMRSFTRSQLRKSTNRNKKKTRRNKRTKNIRGGKILTNVEGDTTSTFDTDTKQLKITFLDKNGENLVIFEGIIDESGNGNGLLNTYRNDKLFSTYTGDFKHTKKHGQGTLDEPNGIYIGQWENDKKHGIGTEFNKPNLDPTRWWDAVKIDGVWENDKCIKGKMKTTSKNGTFTIYEGELDGPRHHGRGKCDWYDADGNLVKSHDGMWVNDVRNGEGVSIWYHETGGVKAIRKGVWSDDKWVDPATQSPALRQRMSQPSQPSRPTQPTQPTQTSQIPLLSPPPKNLAALSRKTKIDG